MVVLGKILNDFQRSTTAPKSSILDLIGFLDPSLEVLERKLRNGDSFW